MKQSLIKYLLLTPLVFVGHIFYDFGIGRCLFGLAGGIREAPNCQWTQLGGISWAFETPLYVPGSYIMASSNIGPCMWEYGPLGLLLILAASAIVALATSQLIIKILNKEQNKFGKMYWRLVVVILGWVFIPVPVEMTMTYELTVLC